MKWIELTRDDGNPVVIQTKYIVGADSYSHDDVPAVRARIFLQGQEGAMLVMESLTHIVEWLSE